MNCTQSHIDSELYSHGHIDSELYSQSHIDSELYSQSHIDSELYSQSHVDSELLKLLKQHLNIGVELSQSEAVEQDHVRCFFGVSLVVRSQSQQHLHHPLYHLGVKG